MAPLQSWVWDWGTLQVPSQPSPGIPRRWRCCTIEGKPNPRQGPGQSVEVRPGLPVPSGLFGPPSHAQRLAWTCCLAHSPGRVLASWAGGAAGAWPTWGTWGCSSGLWVSFQLAL